MRRTGHFIFCLCHHRRAVFRTPAGCKQCSHGNVPQTHTDKWALMTNRALKLLVSRCLGFYTPVRLFREKLEFNSAVGVNTVWSKPRIISVWVQIVLWVCGDVMQMCNELIKTESNSAERKKLSFHRWRVCKLVSIMGYNKDNNNTQKDDWCSLFQRLHQCYCGNIEILLFC